MDLYELLQHGEGQSLEFKKSLSLRREGLEALCAMVNADAARGTVLFGVKPDGSACGIEPGNSDKAQRSLSQAIRSGFEPPLIAEISIDVSQEKPVLVLTAQRDPAVPYHEYDSRAWIRQGSENRQLSLSEKDQLRRKRDRVFHPGPWKCDRCGSIAGTLSCITVTDQGVQKTYDCPCGGQFWPVT
jgi:predicted HTH transcriptional regulator